MRGGSCLPGALWFGQLLHQPRQIEIVEASAMFYRQHKGSGQGQGGGRGAAGGTGRIGGKRKRYQTNKSNMHMVNPVPHPQNPKSLSTPSTNTQESESSNP